jgi:hypothetical protein
MIQFSLDGCPSYVMVVVESNYPYLLGAEQLRSSSTLERQPRSSSVWKCSLDSSTLFVRPCVRGALVYPQTISFSHSLRIELCRVFRVVPVSKCRLSEVCLPPSLKKSLPSPQLYDLPTLDLALPLPNPSIPFNSIPERHPLPRPRPGPLVLAARNRNKQRQLRRVGTIHVAGRGSVAPKLRTVRPHPCHPMTLGCSESGPRLLFAPPLLRGKVDPSFQNFLFDSILTCHS